jgi:hypothetical protein
MAGQKCNGAHMYEGRLAMMVLNDKNMRTERGEPCMIEGIKHDRLSHIHIYSHIYIFTYVDVHDMKGAHEKKILNNRTRH